LPKGLAGTLTRAASKWRSTTTNGGKGIDSQVLEEGCRAGHFGLPGMQERAALAGGKLAVWCEPDSGTEIELTIPAAIAYSTVRSRA
jgi:signal transduction histidine kinase